MDIKALRQIGETTINTESHAVESLPMQRWTDFPLHFSVEYKVKSAFGFKRLASPYSALTMNMRCSRTQTVPSQFRSKPIT